MTVKLLGKESAGGKKKCYLLLAVARVALHRDWAKGERLNYMQTMTHSTASLNLNVILAPMAAFQTLFRCSCAPCGLQLALPLFD